MDVTLPNGVVISGVPDGTPKDIIMQKAISAGLAVEADFVIQPAQPLAQQPVSALNPDVPGMTGEPNFSQAAPKNRSFVDTATGVGEAALTLGTGATSGALGFLGGSVEGIAKELTGQIPSGEGAKIAQQRAADLTYTPKGEAGQQFVGDIGQALSVLPPVSGATTLGGAKNIGMLSSKNKLIRSIATDLPEGVQKSFTKKLGNDRFNPKVFGMVKEARKQGFDDSVTTLIANASKTDRRKMAKMVSIVESGKGDARLKALNRTADVAGDALIKKIDFVKGNNNQAGRQLGRVAETLKGKKVDMSQPVNGFISELKDKLGVTFDDNLKPIFEGSEIESFGESQKLVNDLALRIKRNPNPDAFEAHKFKKLIDKFVRYGKSDGKLDPDLERAAKSLRNNINDNLSSEFKLYGEANKQFSDTITALDNLQDVAGQKLDFSGPNASKAAGTLLRSQTNNTKGRANLLTAIKSLEDTAQKYGGSFDDDILNLSIFADELDAVFGSGARTSLRGEVGKAGVDAAIDISQMTIPGALTVGAKAITKRARGINEKNQLKSIKNLLRGNQ
jgi:hypothetical protein